MLVDINYPDGDGVRAGILLETQKVSIHDLRSDVICLLVGVFAAHYFEMRGSEQINELGIAQELGSMEGKEIRIGSAGTALWSQVTTVTSNGSVNGMHDSLTPITGMFTMLNMMINCWFGGVGVGFMN